MNPGWNVLGIVLILISSAFPSTNKAEQSKGKSIGSKKSQSLKRSSGRAGPWDGGSCFSCVAMKLEKLVTEGVQCQCPQPYGGGSCPQPDFSGILNAIASVRQDINTFTGQFNGQGIGGLGGGLGGGGGSCNGVLAELQHQGKITRNEMREGFNALKAAIQSSGGGSGTACSGGGQYLDTLEGLTLTVKQLTSKVQELEGIANRVDSRLSGLINSFNSVTNHQGGNGNSDSSGGGKGFSGSYDSCMGYDTLVNEIAAHNEATLQKINSAVQTVTNTMQSIHYTIQNGGGGGGGSFGMDGADGSIIGGAGGGVGGVSTYQLEAAIRRMQEELTQEIRMAKSECMGMFQNMDSSYRSSEEKINQIAKSFQQSRSEFHEFSTEVFPKLVGRSLKHASQHLCTAEKKDP